MILYYLYQNLINEKYVCKNTFNLSTYFEGEWNHAVRHKV